MVLSEVGAADSDGDGYTDGFEAYHGTDASNAAVHPSSIYNKVELYLPLDLSTQSGSTLTDLADANDHSLGGNASIGAALFGEGLVLDGSSSSLSAGNVLDTGVGSYTVSLWFKANQLGGVQFLAGKGNYGSGSDGWSIWLFDDHVRLRGNYGVDGSSRLTVEKGGIVAGRWHHVVLVIDQTEGKWIGYLDGVSSESIDSGWTVDSGRSNTFTPGVDFDNANPLVFGARGDGLYSLNGVLDDAVIARTEWSQEQISYLYDSALYGYSFGQVSDTDEDGLPDIWELAKLGNLLSSGSGDNDNDYATNVVEFSYTSNPLLGDSDNDGHLDGYEIGAGSDALAVSQVPSSLYQDVATYHSFDSVSGGQSYDAFGYHNASLAGSNVAVVQSELAGMALRTPNSGGGERADFGNVLDTGSSSYTVSLWFKPDTVGGRVQYIASKGNASSSTDGWSIWLNYDGILIRGNHGVDGGSRLTLRRDGLKAGQWYHVALVINQETGTWEASLNGEHSGDANSQWYIPSGRTDTFTPGVDFDNSESLKLGVSPSNSNDFRGYIDDFLIARRAFTASELAGLHTSGRVGVGYGDHHDSDANGLPDHFENLYFSGAANPMDDADGDGFSNVDEFLSGTRPDLADTDGDSISDPHEIQNGSIPWDVNSVPAVEELLDIPGYLAIERWDGHIGYDVADLTGDDMFYEAPTHLVAHGNSRYFDIPQGTGIRMRGHITAPESGYYQFWLSASNAAELWLSNDSSKYTKQRIAVLGREVGSGHGIRDYSSNLWDIYVSQMSAPVYLEAGQKYFIETLSSQYHIGNRHISLAWARPGQDREPLDMSHMTLYLGEDEDADDDYLPDTWETQYGLSVTDNGLTDRSSEGERGDYDSDGLSNREEYLAGTNPVDADTDGDGLSDSDELRSYHTNPLVSDAPDETMASALDLTTYFDADHSWSMIDGGLISDTFRGSISWNFAVPSSGAWVIQVDTRLRGTVYANDLVHVNAYIDGIFVGRYALRYGSSNKSIMRMISPDLATGNHVLKLEIDNLLGRRMVQIDGISLRQPSGIDLDSDGIPDWIEEQLAKVDFVKQHATTSRTSPFCLEGRARIRESLLLNGGTILTGGDPHHWYANLSLLSSFDTNYTVDFANGQQVQGEVYWWATNVLDNETLTIRQGDSLRLGAWIGNGSSANTEHPNKKASQGNGVVSTITVEGVANHLGNSRDTYEHQFDTPGTYLIDATHVSGATGTLTVIVKGAVMPDDTTVVQNSVSYWTLLDTQADRTLYFEAGEGLSLGDLEEIDGASYKFRFYPEAGGYYGVVARLWEGGPILDVADITSVSVTDALQNGLSMAFNSQEYEGYYVVTTPMVVQDLPEGGKVVVTIYRSGVTFLDGTKKKTFYSSDFVDGLINLKFLMPVGLDGGYCHYIDIYDANGARIGRR